MGVDYYGTGPIRAIGQGSVVGISHTGQGWRGEYVEYKLTSGKYAGRYVYVAEGIAPVQGIHAGEKLKPGQTLGHFTGPIETGWGTPEINVPYALTHGGYYEGEKTVPGKQFASFLRSLGAPYP